MSRLKLSELALALTSILAALLLAEVVVRIARDPIPDVRPSLTAGDPWGDLLHRRSAVPGLAYELVPNRQRNARGALVRTNSYGMRDDEPQPEGGRVVRVAAIGDSYTFGFGVSGAEAWPNVLERLLRARAPLDRPEVLNFGVAGYSTRDEVLTLQHKAMQWHPAAIILGYTLNDPEIDPIQPLHRHFAPPRWWRRSELLSLIVLQKFRWDIRRLGAKDYFHYLHADPRKWGSVVEGFKTIGAIARESEVPALVALFPETRRGWPEYPYADLHEQVASAATAAGLDVLDLVDTFSDLPAEELRLSASDGHPSVRAHELAAQAIARWLVARLPGASESR